MAKMACGITKNLLVDFNLVPLILGFKDVYNLALDYQRMGLRSL